MKRAAQTDKSSRLATARAIETSAVGSAPHSVRLWRAGANNTDKGSLNFTPDSAKAVMAAFEGRGNPLVFDYEHESLLPLEQRGGSPMKGIASAPHAQLEVRDDAQGKPELWAVGIEWTPEAKRQIESGERRQISPVSNFDTETREVLEIVNVALCREGATHFGTLLASVAKGTSAMGLDDLIQAICDAAAAMDWEKVEALCAQAEALPEGGGAATAKMGRAMAKMAVDGEKKDDVAPPPPMAATRTVTRSMLTNTEIVALSRELEVSKRESATALKEARVGRVEGLIATNRDLFDAADERVHLRRADPDVTREHIDSLKRKVATGQIAASRGTGVEAARPPKDQGKEDPTFGLRQDQIEMVDRMNAGKPRLVSDGKGGMKSNPQLLTLEAFSRSQARQASNKATRSGTVA